MYSIPRHAMRVIQRKPLWAFLVAIVALALLFSIVAPITTASAGNGHGQDVCPSGDGWVKTENIPDNTYQVTITAPDGKVIVGTCLKAASGEPQEKVLEPGETSVTLISEATNAQGVVQAISHYAVLLADAPPYDECAQLPGNQPEGTLCERAPDTIPVNDERWTCESGYQTRGGTQTVSYLFDPESNSLIAQPPVTEWGAWLIQRELTATEKEELGCTKPAQPEPLTTPLSDERMSCEGGYETRTGLSTVSWVWGSEAWEWTKAEPVEQWGPWTFVRELNSAEKAELDCAGDPDPVIVTLPQLSWVCVCDGDTSYPAWENFPEDTDHVSFERDGLSGPDGAFVLGAYAHPAEGVEITPTDGWEQNEGGVWQYTVVIPADACVEVVPTPTPTPTVTPTPSPTATPITNPITPTPTASPTKAASPTETLASTGSNGVVTLGSIAALALLAGVGFLALRRRMARQ